MKKIISSVIILVLVGVFFLTPLQFNVLHSGLTSLLFGPNIGFSIAYAGASNPLSWALDGIGTALLGFWKLVIYDLTQVLAIFSGWFLDFFLKHSITSVSYRTGLIESGWEIIRDLVNIVFIFSLMIIAFQKVFGADKSSVNKRLMKTIVIGLVMNFSLYMSYLIVDSSNILANLFYNRITTEGEIELRDPGLEWMAQLFQGDTTHSVSTALMAHINVQRIAQVAPTSEQDNWDFFILYTLAGFINILIASIFFSVSLVFLSRTVGLFILAVLSPLALATLTIPKAESIDYIGFKTWLNQLLGLAFTAPVFLFFIYITVLFASSDGFMSTIFHDMQEKSILTTVLSVALPFAFLGTILLLSKKVTTSLAGKLGGMVSEYITKAATGVAAAGAIVATGGAAAAGGAMRGAGALAGRAGYSGAEKALASGGKLLQTAKFDLNKIPGFKKQLGGLGTAGDLLGRGMNTSYADADTAVRRGVNSVRTGIDNTLTGKTPESVKKWQDNVNASNDARINSKAENAARKAQEEAMVTDGIVSLDENGNIRRDANGKIIKESHKGKKTKKLLEEKRAQAGRMTEEEKKLEKEQIKNEVTKVEEQIKEKKLEIAQAKKAMNTEKNPAVARDIAQQIQMKEELMKNLEKDIETIKNSSVEGTIKQIEDQIKTVADSAKANILKGASTSQAARIQSGNNSSSKPDTKKDK